MSRTKTALRFVLALVAFIVLLGPLSALFTFSPDPYSFFLILGILSLFVAVPLAVVFVRRSRSLERLWAYLLIVNVLAILVGLVVGGLGGSIQLLIGQSDVIRTLTNVTVIVVAYGFAFYLVYRGGYTRLKTRFA